MDDNIAAEMMNQERVFAEVARRRTLVYSICEGVSNDELEKLGPMFLKHHLHEIHQYYRGD